MIGASIGGYRISEKLAEGGMGEVYIARHDLMERDAVVKVLLRELSVNQELVKRFFNEARAAASIHHPGIVEVYDMGYSADGRAYIIMERLRGESLASRLRRGRPGPGEAAAMVRHLAGAIGAAHERGIVHRDLKPDNIFIVPDPDVPGGRRTKVLDFGVAKLAARGGRSLATKAGSIFGTPAYMAPEQCSDSAAVDHRADLYAIGCILYELLCGQPPFGQGGIELLAAQLRDTPRPPRTLVPELPPRLEAITLRLLEKRPEARLQTCAELVEQLRGAEQELGAAVAIPAAVVSAHAPTMTPPAGLPAAFAPTAHAPHPDGYPAPVAPVTTTRQLASGEAVNPPTAGDRWWVLALIGGALVLGGLVFGVVQWSSASAGDGGDQTELAASGGPSDPAEGSPPPPIATPAPVPSAPAPAGPPEPTIEVPPLPPPPAPAPSIDEGKMGPKDVPPEVTAWLTRADADLAAGRWSEASAGYRKVADGKVLRSRGLLGLAQVAWQTKDLAATIEHAKAAAAAGAGSSAQLLLGHAYFKKGEYERARTAYRQVLSIAPGNKEAQTALREIDKRLGLTAKPAAPKPAPKPTTCDEVSCLIDPGQGCCAARKKQADPAPTSSAAELIAQARQAGREGRWGKSLQLCEQAAGMQPGDQDTALVCALAACNIMNAGKAKKYIGQLNSPSRQGMARQVCLKNRIDIPVE